MAAIADIIVDFFKRANRFKWLTLRATPTQGKALYKSQPCQVPFYHTRYKIDQVNLHYNITKIVLKFDEFLINEKFSDKEQLLEDIATELKKDIFISDPLEDLLNDLRSYLKTIKKEWLPNPEPNPWLKVKLSDYPLSEKIYSNSQKEMLQILVWTVREFKPRKILEIGSLFGHTLMLMMEACSGDFDSLLAIDPFRWYEWMENFVPDPEKYRSCKDLFRPFMDQVPNGWRDKIRVISEELGGYELSEADEKILRDQQFDFVFLDFTEKEHEFDRVWEHIEPQLIADHSLILVNGITRESIQFFTKIAPHLEAVAKPGLKEVKLFRYITETKQEEVLEKANNEEVCDSGDQGEEFEILGRKLNIQYDPEWSHHHENAFGQAIENLKASCHDDDANVVFIAAVEQYICEAEEILDRPWIGIVHNVVSYPELFYVPDLKRLCSPFYSPWLRYCKGLFTLTKVQEDYLKENLAKNLEFAIPIKRLKYPIAPSKRCSKDFQFKAGIHPG